MRVAASSGGGACCGAAHASGQGGVASGSPQELPDALAAHARVLAEFHLNHILVAVGCVGDGRRHGTQVADRHRRGPEVALERRARAEARVAARVFHDGLEDRVEDVACRRLEGDANGAPAGNIQVANRRGRCAHSAFNREHEDGVGKPAPRYGAHAVREAEHEVEITLADAGLDLVASAIRRLRKV